MKTLDWGPPKTREWYQGLADLLGADVDSVLWWQYVQMWRWIGIAYEDVDKGVREYLIQYTREVQDVLDHLDDPENTPISGAAGNMWQRGA